MPLPRITVAAFALAALWTMSGCNAGLRDSSSPEGASLEIDESLAFSHSSLLFGLPDIELLDVENGLRTIGEPGKYDVVPIWSPDGSRLSYRQEDGWESDFYLLDIASWETRRITDDGFYKVLPRWSPDSEYLAYLSANEAGDPSGKSDFLNVLELSSGNRWDFPFERVQDYRWGLDSQSMLVISSTGEGTSLEEVRLDGSRRSYNQNFIFLDGANAVSLSPDLSRVAYVLPETDPDALVDPLYIASVGSAGGLQVGGYAIDSSMVWSPDSASLAFVSFDEDFHYALFVVSADGSGLKELLVLDTADDSGEILPGAPAWSPDGKKLAISSFSSSTGSAIFILRADGSETRRVTKPDGLIYDIAWRP